MFSLFLLGSSEFNSNGINQKEKGLSHGIYFNYLGGTVSRLPGFFTRNLKKIKSSWLAFFLLLKKGKSFDVLYLYSPSLPFFLPIYLYAILTGKPVVAEKTENELSRIPENFKDKINLFFEKLNQRILPQIAKHLVVISNPLKKHYLPLFGEKRLTVIPVIVETERFERIQMNGHLHNRIGYLGSFGKKDGVEGLIQAFSQAKNTNGGLKLRLIGFNPNPAYFDNVLKKAGLNGEVEKTGQVTYQQIPELLADCDLLVVNRTNEPYSHYGFPTKLAEYLATGIPTVATKVGDIEYYLENNKDAILIDPDNSAALSEVIESRYKAGFDYHALGNNGRITCKTHFSYRPHVIKLLQIFKSLAN